MNEDIIKLKEDIESFLKDSMEHQDKQIEYIIRNPKNEDTYVLASDGNEEAIEFTPQSKNYKEGFSYVPEWDYNFDYYIYNYLEEGYKIEYMSPNTHYGIRNSIHELYPDDIEFKDGVQSYLQYCVDNKITKQFIDKETGLDSPEVLQLFNGLAKGTYMEYKGYIALSVELNYDNQNEVLVNTYNSMQDFVDGESLETISLNEINLKDNIKEYIDDNYISTLENAKFDNGYVILETGTRKNQPVALIQRSENDYVIAFNYKIKDNNIEWSYGYYYEQYKDLAKKDFDKVVSGGNLLNQKDERSR